MEEPSPATWALNSGPKGAAQGIQHNAPTRESGEPLSLGFSAFLLGGTILPITPSQPPRTARGHHSRLSATPLPKPCPPPEQSPLLLSQGTRGTGGVMITQLPGMKQCLQSTPSAAAEGSSPHALY